MRAAEAALDAGDSELALALAWTAKDALEDPKPAYRVMRRAVSAGGGVTLDDVALLEFQPGGDSFALVQRPADKLQLFSSANWTLNHAVDAADAPITALAYSPDGGLLVTGSATGEVVIRAPQTGTAIRRLIRHQAAVTALAFDPAGDRLYSAGGDPLLVAWDSESGDAMVVLAAGAEDALPFSDLLVTADGGRIIAWANDGGITQTRQFAADALEPIPADGAARPYRGVDASGTIGYSGGRSLPAYPRDPHVGDLTLWDLTSGEPIATVTEGFNWSLLAGGELTAATDELLFIAFHEDLALLGVRASDGGQRAALINTTDGSLIRSFESELAASLASADFLDATTLLSVTNDDRVILWSSADGTVIRQLAAAPQALASVTISANGSVAVGRAADGSAFLWRLKARRATPAASYPGALPGTALSPSGESMLLVNDSGATLLPVRDSRLGRDHQSIRSPTGQRRRRRLRHLRGRPRLGP